MLASLPGVTLFPFLPEVPFTFAMTPEQRAGAAAFYAGLLERVEQRRDLDLVVLDEVLDAVNAGLLPEESLLHFLKNRPSGQEVVLTGRNPSEALCRWRLYHRYARREAPLCLRAGGAAGRRMVKNPCRTILRKVDPPMMIHTTEANGEKIAWLDSGEP